MCEEKAEDTEKRAAEVQKLQLEIRSLHQKVEGQERASLWQKIQSGAVAVGVLVTAVSVVVAFRSYLKSVDDQRNRDYQTAVEHFAKGYPGGAIELARLGPDGLQALVYGIDATGEGEKQSWPQVTLVALDQLNKRRDVLTDDQKLALRAAQLRNDARMHEQLLLFESANDKDAALRQISDLLCVQKKFQQLTPFVPPQWAETEKAAVTQLGASPHC